MSHHLRGFLATELPCSETRWNRPSVWRERKPTRCTNQMFIINFCLNMFRASLCPSSGEQRPCVTAYGVLRCFCWMWLVAVLGRCVVGCEQKQRSTPYTVTHGLCSTEDGHNDARNMLRQKLIIIMWLVHLVGLLSLHNLLTMHGHRNLKTLGISSLNLRDQISHSCKVTVRPAVSQAHPSL